MKKIALFLVLLSPLLAKADVLNVQCSLYWDYVQHAEYPHTGFNLYDEGTKIFTIDSATERSVSCADAGLVPGSYNLTMTAFNADVESDHSNPLEVTIVAFPSPKKLRLTITFE